MINSQYSSFLWSI